MRSSRRTDLTSALRAARVVGMLLALLLACGIPADAARADAGDAITGTARTNAGQLAAGKRHSCVILGTGAVRCWGANDRYQLALRSLADVGASATGDASAPINLGSGRTATAIAAGHEHTCALLDDGSVRCWGDNHFGQLGQGNTSIIGDDVGEAPVRVDLGAGRTATAIAAGGNAACAILDDATLRCWGDGARGQFGPGNITNIGDQPGESTVGIDLGPGRTATAVAIDEEHTCVVLDNGKLRCAGWNGFAQLSFPASDVVGVTEAMDLGPGHTAIAVSAGDHHTCVILEDHTVRCWGNDRFWGNGPAPTREMLAPDLGPGRTATALSAGNNHSCVILDDATLRCWGLGPALGQGNANGVGDQQGEVPVPVDLGPSRTALAVVTGTAHTCAVGNDGSVHCWGANGSGQLGQGNTSNYGSGPRETPAGLPAIDLGGVRAIRGSDSDGDGVRDDADQCVLEAARTATGCRPPAAPTPAPTPYPHPQRTTDGEQLATGRGHTCAIVQTGAVRCAGVSLYGPLVPGSGWSNVGDEPGESTLPIDLGPARTATAIDASFDHTCAILDTGGLRCWGDPLWNQLGSDRGEWSVAVDLGRGRKAVSVAAGLQITCAALDDGAVRCWGDPLNYLLTVDDNTETYAPTGPKGIAVNLGAGQKATAVAAGGLAVCAIVNGGAVRCWGPGFAGMLAQGNTENIGDNPGETAVPVDLGPGRTATAITAGSGHMCAILDNGALRCWGWNRDGQLGQGNTDNIGDDPGETTVPVDLGPGRTAIAVSASFANTCAILDNGSLRCWGENRGGELGQGNTDNIGDNPGETTVPVDLGPGRTAIAVSVSSTHTCAILDDRTTRCWGRNSAGQLGQGNTASFGTATGEVPAALPPIQLGGQLAIRDTDADGVRDPVDQCVTVSGTPPSGCPDPAPTPSPTPAPPNVYASGSAFVRGTQVALAAKPSQVVAADFNGDTYPDLAAASADTGAVWTLQGRGDGRFEDPVLLAGGPTAGAFGLAIADLDEDGNDDLTTGNRVFLGYGQGDFAPGIATGLAGNDVVTGDLDADGHQDLALTDASAGTLRVALGRGDATFASPTTYPVTARTSSPIAADVDRDGDLDLAVGGRDPGDRSVTVLRGDGDGHFTTERLATSSPAASIAVGDLNGDVRPDLSTGAQRLMGRADGTFGAAQPAASGDEAIAIADFTGDGNEDQIVTGSGNTGIFLSSGRGDGTFDPSRTYETSSIGGTQPADLATADLDSDGRTDLIAAKGGAGLEVLTNGNAALTSGVGKALITEVRFGRDAYLNIYNRSRSKVLRLDGWQVAFRGAGHLTLPASTLVQPGGVLLIASPAHGGSSLAAIARSVFPMPAAARGVTLLDPVGAGVDSVDLSGLPAARFTAEGAYVRKRSAGVPIDRNIDRFDFQALDTRAYERAGTVLGAPRPDAAFAPTNRNDILQSSLLAPAASQKASPNRVVRPGTATRPTTLTINRTVTNCSGGLTSGVCVNADRAAPAVSVKRLRFRITDLTTFGSGPYGPRLVAVGSADASYDGVAVKGLPLDAPSPSSGGGINSTLTATSLLPPGGLAPGQSINVAFTFEVYVGGDYTFAFDAEDDVEPYAAPLTEDPVKSGGDAGAPAGDAATPPAALPVGQETTGTVPASAISSAPSPFGTKAPPKTATPAKRCVSRAKYKRLSRKQRARVRICKVNTTTSKGRAR